MSKFIIGIFIMVGMNFQGYGQIRDFQRNPDFFNPNGGFNFRSNKPSVDGMTIEGSRHLFPTWNGNYIIQSLKGEKFSLSSLNYNLQTKKLESMLTPDSIFELKTINIDLITAGNKRYKIINEEVYQEIISMGKVRLYKSFTVKVQDAFLNPMTKSVSEPPQYIQEPNYFYINNSTLAPFKLKKRDVLNIFKDKESEIKKFVDENNLIYSEEADVIRIFKYYNKI